MSVVRFVVMMIMRSMAVIVFVIRMVVSMRASMTRRVRMPPLLMLMLMRMLVFVVMMIRMVRGVSVMMVREVDVELHSFDIGFLLATGMEVVTLHAQFFQFVLQPVKIDAQIDQGAKEHVATDAAENIEIKGLHECFVRLRPSGALAISSASVLIWLAA